MEEDEPTGYVTFKNLSSTLLRIMLLIKGFTLNLGLIRLPVRDDDEKLFRAFQVLDTEKRGYLLPEELKDALMNYGEVFLPEEMDEMLTVNSIMILIHLLGMYRSS